MSSFHKQKCPNKKVLDVGCGTGLLTKMALRAGASKVLGCEVVSDLADICREEFKEEKNVRVGMYVSMYGIGGFTIRYF